MHLGELQSSAPAGGDAVIYLRAFGSTELELELRVYNRWMADEKLRYETGTDEIMTAEDVAHMQKEWLIAPDKFNYIIWYNNRVPIGDIGLFYKTVDDAVDYTEGEISMMIAENSVRRSGFGKLAHDLVIAKAKEQFGTQKIVAKIKVDNLPSIQFFQKKLGYKEVSRCEVFNEVTLELVVI